MRGRLPSLAPVSRGSLENNIYSPFKRTYLFCFSKQNKQIEACTRIYRKGATFNEKQEEAKLYVPMNQFSWTWTSEQKKRFNFFSTFIRLGTRWLTSNISFSFINVPVAMKAKNWIFRNYFILFKLYIPKMNGRRISFWNFFLKMIFFFWTSISAMTS